MTRFPRRASSGVLHRRTFLKATATGTRHCRGRRHRHCWDTVRRLHRKPGTGDVASHPSTVRVRNRGHSGPSATVRFRHSWNSTVHASQRDSTRRPFHRSGRSSPSSHRGSSGSVRQRGEPPRRDSARSSTSSRTPSRISRHSVHTRRSGGSHCEQWRSGRRARVAN
jgi:hypothetical protein